MAGGRWPDRLSARQGIPAEHPVVGSVRPAAALRRAAQLPPGDRRSDGDRRDAPHVRVRGARGLARGRPRDLRRGHAAPPLPGPWDRARDPGAAVGAALGGQRGALAARLRPRQRPAQQPADQPPPDQRAARLAGRRSLGDRVHHDRPRLGRAAAREPDLPGRPDEHPAGALQRVLGRRRRRLAPVPLHHAPAAAAVDRGRGHDRDAARGRDLRRGLRAQRHGPEHALDPDPGLHDVLRRGRLRPRHGARVPAGRGDGRSSGRSTCSRCGGRRDDQAPRLARDPDDLDRMDRGLVARPDRDRGRDEHLEPARRARGARALDPAHRLARRLPPAPPGHRARRGRAAR